MSKKTPRDEHGRILPGHSLNPKGKPKGSVSHIGKLRAALTEELPEIIETLIALAKQGDVQACRILLDRVLPPLRAEAMPVEIVGMAEKKGLFKKAETVVSAVARGEITTDTAIDLMRALGALAKIKEIDNLEQRIIALEGKAGHVTAP